MYNLIAVSETFTRVLFIISMCSLPLLVYVIIAGVRVNTTFTKYNRVATVSGMSGAEAARKILDEAGLPEVGIENTPGVLTDHYDPRTNVVYLSDATHNNRSIGAVGVAAHEAGHAIQYAGNYLPVKLRAAIVPVISFTSKFSMPLILISIILEMIFGFGNPVANWFLAISLIFYGVYMIFTLITLPVEYNASSRAKKLLTENNIVNAEEAVGIKRVLSAAAQTYLSSFLYSFVQFARLLLMLISRRNHK